MRDKNDRYSGTDRPSAAKDTQSVSSGPAGYRAHPRSMRMRYRSLCHGAGIIFSILSIALMDGCASTHEPINWSRSVNEMPTNVYGSWIWLTLDTTAHHKTEETFGGELIAVSQDSLYVASPFVRVISRKSVVNARLTAFDSNQDNVGLLTIVGNLSTISNGFFGLLTGPMWIIGGIIAGTTRSFTPVIDYPKQTMESMSLYARFPAGIPEGVDRTTLIMMYDRRKPFGF